MALCLSALLAACGDPDPATDDGVTDFISDLQSPGGGTVTRETGDFPAGGSCGAPTVTATGTVINGATVQVTVAAGEAFDRVIIGVDGASGFYDVALPAAVLTTDLLLTLSQTLTPGTIEFVYSVGSGSDVCQSENVPATVVPVGTGEVQVSVSWDVDSDVDLHVVDPDGDEVYYGRLTVASGGMLDLDSNAGCSIDHVRLENITWETAPAGTYVVRLDYFLACSVAATSYVVTVQRQGHDPEVFSGEFTGAGDSGGEGSGIDITTFTMP